MNRHRLAETMIRGALVVGACLAAGIHPAVAAADMLRQIEFQIPAQQLPSALLKFAAQSGVQVTSPGELVEGKSSGVVVGKFDAGQALGMLLQGTGLRFDVVDENTVLIVATAALGQGSPSGSSLDAHNGAADGPVTTSSSSLSPQEAPSGWSRLAQATNEGRESQEKGEPESSRNQGREVQEIVVTAQKRSERLQDVPISIVAMDSDELQRRKVTSLDDLALAVPGLAIQSTGTWQRRIVLRGISNFFGNSSLIGLYLDEASVTSLPDMQLYLSTYDLERVEVLRGPQGTLYGEGSVGGTIRFITKDPVLNRFTLDADVAALFTQDGAPGQRLEGALNVPLGDELGLRIAGTFDHQGGWLDQPAADRNDYNDQNIANVRVKGLWQPAPQFTVNAMALLHRNDAAPSIGEDANGNFTQVFNLTTTPSVKDDYELYNLTLSYDFTAVRALSTTSYLNQSKDASNLGYTFPFTPPGTPRFDYYTSQFFANKTLTEELRLTSSGAGPWQWTIGGFYRDARVEGGSPSESFFDLRAPPGTPLPEPFSFGYSTLSRSTAIFGDTSYRLTDRLTIGTGLRYFEDKQESKDTGAGATAVTQAGTFHALNPRIYAQYRLTNRINAYTSAAKGFRSGGFNSLDQPSYDPEQVWTYELGAKASLLDGRLYADVAVFHSDYRDYQILGVRLPPDPPVNITSNAGNARIRGVEWGLSWRVTDQWSLAFNGDYIDSEFREINVASSSYAVGDPLDLTPRYSFTVSAQRDFELNGRPGFFRLDYNQPGRSTYRNRSIGPWYYSESDIIDMLNLNLGLRWSDSLSLGAFAQNLLNDRGFTDPQSIQDSASRARPRTFGIGFSVAFE